MSNTEKPEHCLLCEHQIIDYQKGTLCGLSNEKPRFNERCHEINFKGKLEGRIIELNANLQHLKKSNTVVGIYAISFFILGLLVIFGAYQLAAFVFSKGFILSIPIIISAAGLSLILKAISTYVNHYNQFSVAKNYKVSLDKLLQLYSITYNISITLEKEIHGEKRFIHDLKIIKN